MRSNLWLGVSDGKRWTLRIARPFRIEYTGAVYHVMNRGLARHTVFCDPTGYETFL